MLNTGKHLTKKELKQLLTNPTWSLSILLKNPAGFGKPKIDVPVVKKMLRISGLDSDISKTKMTSIKKALETQIIFINHLYDRNDSDNHKSSNNEHFRLLPGDHRKTEPLSLKRIEKEVSQLKASSDKGETGFSIRDMQEGKFFVINARQ